MNKWIIGAAALLVAGYLGYSKVQGKKQQRALGAFAGFICESPLAQDERFSVEQMKKLAANPNRFVELNQARVDLVPRINEELVGFGAGPADVESFAAALDSDSGRRDLTDRLFKGIHERCPDKFNSANEAVQHAIAYVVVLYAEKPLSAQQ